SRTRTRCCWRRSGGWPTRWWTAPSGSGAAARRCPCCAGSAATRCRWARPGGPGRRGGLRSPGAPLARRPRARARPEVYRQWRQALAGILRAAADRGELAAGVDPEAEAAALAGFIDGLALQAVFDPAAFAPARQAALLDARLAAVRRDRTGAS